MQWLHFIFKWQALFKKTTTKKQTLVLYFCVTFLAQENKQDANV